MFVIMSSEDADRRTHIWDYYTQDHHRPLPMIKVLKADTEFKVQLPARTSQTVT